MKNILSVVLSSAALLSAAQAPPMSGSLEHRPLYSGHDRLQYNVQRAKTENRSQEFGFNVPTHPPGALVFNVPTHPPGGLAFNVPTHPPGGLAFNVPTHPPGGLAFNVPTHPPGGLASNVPTHPTTR